MIVVPVWLPQPVSSRLETSRQANVEKAMDVRMC